MISRGELKSDLMRHRRVLCYTLREDVARLSNWPHFSSEQGGSHVDVVWPTFRWVKGGLGSACSDACSWRSGDATAVCTYIHLKNGGDGEELSTTVIAMALTCEKARPPLQWGQSRGYLALSESPPCASFTNRRPASLKKTFYEFCSMSPMPFRSV